MIIEPVLSICCITYNHEKYIGKCLESFISQKVSFPIEIVISNDCSTDNTQEIINDFKERYPALIRDISPSKNLGAINNFYYALSQCKGKYIAYCEGDDYWIDEYKLQSQIDFLEENSEYGMCYTRRKNYIQEKNVFQKRAREHIDSVGREIPDVYDLLNNVNPIGTLTVCMRKDLYMDYIREVNPSEKGWLLGDYPIWLWFSINSKIGYIPKETAVYRILSESASHSRDVEKEIRFRESVQKIKEYYAEHYGLVLPYWNSDVNNFQILYNHCCSDFSIETARMLRETYRLLSKENKDIKKTILVYSTKNRFVFFVVRKFFGLLRRIGGGNK